jgi:pimeloyl-ACP methyl ester carboxylesterase
MAFIAAKDGARIYVKSVGEGPAVVLIHGWPLNADSFDDIALGLADAGFRAISYDRRGFGRSEQTPGGYTYDVFADDLASVIAALGLERTALAGFSMGGGEIARYLSRHGSDKISHAVFISAVTPYLLQTPGNPRGAPLQALEDMKHEIRTDRAEFFSSFFEDFYGVGVITSPVSDGVLHWSWMMAMQAGLKATLDCVDAFGLTDFRPDLKAITVPTLVIHGTADQTAPIAATGRALAKALPDARLVELEGAAHGVLASHRQEVLGELLAFLPAGA